MCWMIEWLMGSKKSNHKVVCHFYMGCVRAFDERRAKRNERNVSALWTEGKVRGKVKGKVCFFMTCAHTKDTAYIINDTIKIARIRKNNVPGQSIIRASAIHHNSTQQRHQHHQIGFICSLNNTPNSSLNKSSNDLTFTSHHINIKTSHANNKTKAQQRTEKDNNCRFFRCTTDSLVQNTKTPKTWSKLQSLLIFLKLKKKSGFKMHYSILKKGSKIQDFWGYGVEHLGWKLIGVGGKNFWCILQMQILVHQVERLTKDLMKYKKKVLGPDQKPRPWMTRDSKKELWLHHSCTACNRKTTS